MLNIKLFCFPYAGGSASIYSRWQPYFNSHNGIELVPIELTGRGRRIHEPLYPDLMQAVEDLYELISNDIKSAPYAFFGHSLGGLLVYELAQKIKQLQIRQPLHLFFSGRGAPNIEIKRKKYHLMNDEEFKDEVIKLGGTPPEFFDHPELTELFLPLLKNDFKLAETNLAQRELNPFKCDISIFSGKEDDKICQEQIDGWKLHTGANCSVHYFEGGHFFLHDEIPEISKLINNALKKHVQRNAGLV